MQSQSSPKVVLRGSYSSLLSSNIAAKCSNLRVHGGGASGKAMALCPNGSGSNPGLYVLRFRYAVNLFCRASNFSQKLVIQEWMLFLRLSCFLSSL